MTHRREVIRLAHAHRTSRTPFFAREVEAFRRDVEAPMDAAWAALPPTERAMFLKEAETFDLDPKMAGNGPNRGTGGPKG